MPQLGFPGGTVIKNLLANAGDAGLIPGLGRSPREGKWQPIPVFLPEYWNTPWTEEPGGL